MIPLAASQGILREIVANKKERLRAGAERLPDEVIPARRDFLEALRASRPAIIAESKKASPSKGVLVRDYDPAAIAREYEAGGAAALSVLTDADFFQGSLGDMRAVRRACSLPVLRKDFTISEMHVEEAAAHGADAILLIAAILTDAELRGFRELAREFGMASLVEVHDAEELERAVGSGAEIIGVNNRDLRTFEVRIETSLELAEKMPSGVVRVSESGIHSHAQVARLMDAGYDAFLVGEHLVKSGRPAEALRDLRCL